MDEGSKSFFFPHPSEAVILHPSVIFCVFVAIFFMYQERVYRRRTTSLDLVGFEVCVKETDLFILAEKEFKEESTAAVLKYRYQLEEYIAQDPGFQSALVPYAVFDLAPKIVKVMANAAKKAQVGPMAAVAGAIADFVGRDLLALTQTNELIIENGGDIFIQTKTPRHLLVFAGTSPFSEKLTIEIAPEQTPCGVCTSSGTVGPSLSFGVADAVTILAPTATLADAAATAVGNAVKEPKEKEINAALEIAKNIEGVLGVLIIIQDKLGVWGQMKLAPV